MAEKKTRVHGMVKEKLELYQYKQDHPTVRVSAYLIFADLEIVREPDADDNLAPVRKAEVDDELIILEEVNSGESGVMVAAPTRTEVQNTKKRKQPAITDFFFKNTNKKHNYVKFAS